MRDHAIGKPAAVLALALALGLGGCAGMPKNSALTSTKQPVVERTNYTFDVSVFNDGLPVREQQRLVGWFDTMKLRYGDRVSIDDPARSAGVRDTIESLAGRYGLQVADGAPITSGEAYPGRVRVVLSRTTASVPGCPDWSAKSDANYGNATYPNYGCAINSNLAAMIADPEDLVRGQQGTGQTVVMSSTKAIDSYRQAPPSGEKGLKENTTASGGK